MLNSRRASATPGILVPPDLLHAQCAVSTLIRLLLLPLALFAELVKSLPTMVWTFRFTPTSLFARIVRPEIVSPAQVRALIALVVSTVQLVPSVAQCVKPVKLDRFLQVHRVLLAVPISSLCLPGRRYVILVLPAVSSRTQPADSRTMSQATALLVRLARSLELAHVLIVLRERTALLPLPLAPTAPLVRRRPRARVQMSAFAPTVCPAPFPFLEEHVNCALWELMLNHQERRTRALFAQRELSILFLEAIILRIANHARSERSQMLKVLQNARFAARTRSKI